MFDKIKTWAQKEWKATLKQFGIKPKEAPTMMTEQNKIYEINLVPEVKRQMIKAMRVRNIMLFVCIILVAVAGATVVIMGGVWESQNISMSVQDGRLKTMSEKLKSYDSLSEFLTIQTQLNDLDEIANNKKVLSRVFPIVSTILPEGPDTIEISELSVDLSTNTIRFDAQADAKVSPYIDYRVLESFKKGVSLMKYDYGRYVDEQDNEIPTRCLVETNSNGDLLVEKESVATSTVEYTYAYWLKGKRGCNPSDEDTTGDEEDEELEAGNNSGVSNSVNQMLSEFQVGAENGEVLAEDLVADASEAEKNVQDEFNKKLDLLDEYGKSLMYDQLNSGIKMEDVAVEKIYRSPRFSEWYKNGNMNEQGEIFNVPHFNSGCITYTGAPAAGGGMKWTSSNDCMLAIEEPSIRDSSNGRDSNGNLVLRFNATITLNGEVFKFTNKHILAISPTGQNVTDSYRQIEGMFAERAVDCSDTDVVCTTASTDSGGGE